MPLHFGKNPPPTRESTRSGHPLAVGSARSFVWATSAGGATPPPGRVEQRRPWTTSGCRESSRGWASTPSLPPRRSASSRTVSLSCLPTPKVHKDQKAPMLMSGCKAADSYCFILGCKT